MLHKKNLQF